MIAAGVEAPTAAVSYQCDCSASLFSCLIRSPVNVLTNRVTALAARLDMVEREMSDSGAAGAGAGSECGTGSGGGRSGTVVLRVLRSLLFEWRCGAMRSPASGE